MKARFLHKESSFLPSLCLLPCASSAILLLSSLTGPHSALSLRMHLLYLLSLPFDIITDDMKLRFFPFLSSKKIVFH